MSKTVNAFAVEDVKTKTMYTVSFSWGDRYNPTHDGVHSVSMTVEAPNKIEALSRAANLIAPLQLPEPDRFDASKKECKCD
jgi:hypothetical protein